MTEPPGPDISLDIWVVYRRPTDLPQHEIVVRRQVAVAGGTWVDPKAYGFPDLASARRWLIELGRGLTRLDRYPDDDPVIVECWV